MCHFMEAATSEGRGSGRIRQCWDCFMHVYGVRYVHMAVRLAVAEIRLGRLITAEACIKAASFGGEDCIIAAMRRRRHGIAGNHAE
jgi:hypothetical protein